MSYQEMSAILTPRDRHHRLAMQEHCFNTESNPTTHPRQTQGRAQMYCLAQIQKG